MPEITLPIHQSDVACFESALADHNEYETTAEYHLPYEAKVIEVISKEKLLPWDESTATNTYCYTLKYAGAVSLFRFAEQVGQFKSTAYWQKKGGFSG